MNHPSIANDELALFRDAANAFLKKEVIPYYESWEREGGMPRDLWNTMGEGGLLCPDMPEEYGAAGASFVVPQIIQEEMWRLGLASIGTGYNIQSNIVCAYINNIGTPEQKKEWLPRMITGEVVTALAMTEPGAGSDVARLATTAVKRGDDYVINGSKTFITNGHHADMVVVCAKTDPQKGAKGISLFLVDSSLPGFTKGQKIEKIGQHSSDTTELFFKDVVVPKSALLGEEHRGFVHLMQELPRERIGVAASAIGAAQGALEQAVDYVQTREVFGQPLSNMQNTRFKLAKVKSDIESSRALYEKHLALFQEGSLSVEDAALLKYATTEMQLRAVSECLQLFGGYGYTKEYPISRFYTDARIQTIYAGTSEIMLEVIARGLVGR